MSERLGLAADWNPDFPRRPDLPTQAEWDLLFSLAGTGIDEWYGEDEDVEPAPVYYEYHALLAKIRTYLKTTGAY